jgi:hypothetical protein
MNNAREFEAFMVQYIFNGLMGGQFGVYLPFQPKL